VAVKQLLRLRLSSLDRRKLSVSGFVSVLGQEGVLTCIRQGERGGNVGTGVSGNNQHGGITTVVWVSHSLCCAEGHVSGSVQVSCSELCT
jgi:hypothetical protein